MITHKEIKEFVDTKPWEWMLYYRITEFLMKHWLYVDDELKKAEFEKQVVDTRVKLPIMIRRDLEKNLTKKVYKILKKRNLL